MIGVAAASITAIAAMVTQIKPDGEIVHWGDILKGHRAVDTSLGIH